MPLKVTVSVCCYLCSHACQYHDNRTSCQVHINIIVDCKVQPHKQFICILSCILSYILLYIIIGIIFS